MLTLHTGWDRPVRPLEGAAESMLMVSVTPPQDAAQLPGNFCLLVDCSGSMNEGLPGTLAQEGESKLEQARRACRVAFQHLHADDLFSLITYNSRCTVRFAARKAATLDVAELDAHLERMVAEGLTRTDQALQKAVDVLKPHSGPHCISSILLITDGHPTDGDGKNIRRDQYPRYYDLADQIGRAQIKLVTIGLGDARCFNSLFLHELAVHGNGDFCHASIESELASKLRVQIQTAHTVVAAEFSLDFQVLMEGAALLRGCCIAPQHRPLQIEPSPGDADENACVHVPIGPIECHPGRPATVLLFHVRTEGQFGLQAGDYDIANIAATWRNAGGSAGVWGPASLGLRFSPITLEQQQLNEDINDYRLAWQLHDNADTLLGTDDVNKSVELLYSMSRISGEMGMNQLSSQLQAQRKKILATRVLDRDSLVRARTMVRETDTLPTGAKKLSPSLLVSGGLGYPFTGESEPAPHASQATLLMDSTRLIVLEGQVPNQTFAVNHLKLIIGRHVDGWMPDIDLAAQERGPTPSVSRRHAELIWDQGRLYLRDLGSSNGTYVNRAPVPGMGFKKTSDRIELASGDEVRFGSVVMQVS